MLLARYAYAAALAKAVRGAIPPRALQRVADLDDYRTLLAVYDGIVRRERRYLAWVAAGSLPQRMLNAISTALS